MTSPDSAPCSRSIATSCTPTARSITTSRSMARSRCCSGRSTCVALTIARTPPEHLAFAAVEQANAWFEAGARPEDVAVLSRVNSLLLPVQLLFGEADVPCWTPVSVAVLNRTGTRTGLAYLRLAVAASGSAGLPGSDLAIAARRPSRSIRREVLQRLERKRQWRMAQVR